MAIKYSEAVNRFLRENVEGRTAVELAEMVNVEFSLDITPAQIASYKKNHHLTSGMPKGLPKGHVSDVFPKPIVDYILTNYRGTGPTEMAQRLNEMFDTGYTTQQLKSVYANHHLNSGVSGRFKKGHVPANKGVKGLHYEGCDKTHFAKGHIPYNKLPIGSEVIKSDGYWWRKIGEGSREWKQLHLILWEDANGPIPGGHKVIFKDGDRAHCCLENLLLVTDGEHAVMNSKGLRFSNPDATEAGLLIAKIKIQAAKRKKSKKKEG